MAPMSGIEPGLLSGCSGAAGCGTAAAWGAAALPLQK
jgi:hypothetical protein